MAPDHLADPARPSVSTDRRSVLADRLEHARLLIQGWTERPWLAGLAVGAVLAVVAGGWWLGRPSSALPIDDAIPRTAGPSTTGLTSGPPGGSGEGGGAEIGVGAAGGGGTDPEPVEVVVHVAGAVNRPGIVHLDAGDRVVDAVDAAGGPTAEADIDQLNLAAPLVDGYQIRVPRVGEEIVAPVGPGPGSGTGPSSGSQAASVGPVDVNRASAAELEALPGIGPSLARAIVAWREEHGPFGQVADLLDVPGIGPSKLSALADDATV